MAILEVYDKPYRILYITNLHYDTTEKELESTFGNIVPIKEVYIFYKSDGTSTGTGEIILHSKDDADILRDRINNTLFKGRIIRVNCDNNRKDVFSHSTYLVDNLPLDVTSKELKEHFRPFIRKRARVLYNEDGSSTGRAIVELRGELYEKYEIFGYVNIHDYVPCKIKDKKMTLRPLCIIGYHGTEFYVEHNKNLELYIANLHSDVKAEDLEAYFGKWFEVAEAVIYYDEDGKSTGTGAISFYNLESTSKIFNFVRKAFEDRIRSVMCPYVPQYYGSSGENVESNFDTIEEEDYSDFDGDDDDEDLESIFDTVDEEVEYYADFDEKVQSTSAQTVDVEKQQKMYSDSEGVGRPSKMDEIILLKQFDKGGSKERLLKLKHYNSFAEQHFRQRSYFVALRLGIPDSDFQCAIYVTNLHCDVTEEELRAFFSAEVPVMKTFVIANSVCTSSGTGMVVFRSRRDRLSCLLLLQNKKLKGRILDMKCVPGLTNRCWDYI